MKNILITGIAGFIGSELAKSMLELGNKVIGVDDLSTGFLENVPKNTIFIKGDVSKLETIETLEDFEIDIIFHFAGQSSGEISFEDPIKDLDSNVKSTLLLLNFSKKRNVKKFFYASSMSVYGDQFDFVDENSPTNPVSFYAIGKLASENYLKAFSSNTLRCVSLRLFNVYGKSQNFKNLKQGMVSIFIALAIKNKSIIVKGSLERFRDFIHVNDVISAIKIIENTELKNTYEVYNICSGNKTEIHQLLDYITSSFKEKVNIEVVGNTPGDQFGIYGDNCKLTKIGWENKLDLKSEINNIIKYITTGPKNLHNF